MIRARLIKAVVLSTGHMVLHGKAHTTSRSIPVVHLSNSFCSSCCVAPGCKPTIRPTFHPGPVNIRPPFRPGPVPTKKKISPPPPPPPTHCPPESLIRQTRVHNRDEISGPGTCARQGPALLQPRNSSFSSSRHALSTKDRALLSSSLARLEGPFVRFLFFLPPEPSTCSPPSPPSLVVAALVCFGLQCVPLRAVRPTQSDSHESVQLTTCEGQPGMILGRMT
jgi:hypothetical protein